jgi:hypothetical protein
VTKASDANARLASAVIAGDIRTVRGALADGADPNLLVQGGGETALMWAVTNDRSTQIARMLLARGARVDERDGMGRTALHHAAQAGRRDAAEVLIAHGARVDTRNTSGQTPLDVTLEISWSLDLIDLLREHMGRTAHADGGRALRVATFQGDHARAWRYVAQGADVKALTAGLRAAAQRGDVALGRGLIDSGALPDGDGADEPPLLVTAWYGQVEFARMLLAAGVDVNARSRTNRTALQAAASTSHAKPAVVAAMVRLLLEAGADPTGRDGEGYGPRERLRSLGRTALIPMVPAAPGERPIDPTAEGIASLLLGARGDVSARYRPNDVVHPLAVTGGHPRDPWGVNCDAAGALGRWREDFENAGVEWAFPLFVRMRDGDWPSYAEVEAAYRRQTGLDPTIERFPS